MSPRAVGFGVGALAFILFGVRLALGLRGGTKARLLLAAVTASALWCALAFAFAVTDSPAYWATQSIFDALRSALWFLFLIALLHRQPWRSGWSLLLGLPFLAWLLYPDSLSATPGAGRASSASFGVLLAVAIAGLVITEQVFRRAAEQARWAIKPLCIGLGAGFAFDLYLFADAVLFGRIDSSVWAARGFAHALTLPLIAVATARNKDWTIDIALSRHVVFHSAAFLTSGLYLLAVAAAGYYVRYFGGSWGKTLQVGFIFAALVVLGWLFSSGTLRAKLRVLVNKHFFSYRYDYRAEWLRFTNLLSTYDPGLSHEQRSIQALANLVESPGGALWLRERERFTQVARWNMPAVSAHEPADGPLCSFLAASGWVVDLRERSLFGDRYPGLEVPQWLEQLHPAWLVVPIIAQEELIGFALLAQPRAEIEVNWEVRDLLKTAARQVGSFLAQVHASEALLEARKFESFNKMSAFVVHDLKNLVTQLSLLLKNAERHRHNPRFQEDMFATVRHVEERMSKLMQQLTSGAGGEGSARPIDLAALLERIVQAKRIQSPSLALRAETGDLTVVGHEQRLERVIGHLVQNAIDATRDAGEVRITLREDGPHALVEVLDSGCGMSEQFVRERLFRPFQTTKGTGMGIGAYEAAQCVKELGGRIEAESRPGDGTRLKIFLPRHRPARSETLPLQEVA